MPSPETIASAPARVDLAGGWTDVPPYTTEVGGAVCNIAIELRAVASVTPLGAPPTPMPDAGLIRAAWQRAGTPDVAIRLHSAIPVGSGLGGSSAAGVALAAALRAAARQSSTDIELAELSRSTETETLGLAGGCQDHYAAALGGALLLNCGRETTATKLPLSETTISELERRTFIVFTGQSRMSSDTIKAVLSAYRDSDPITCGALSAMAALAPMMAEALTAGDVDQLGRLLADQWVAQRALHPTITTPEIDAIVHAATASGALGSKALGASGGGCVLVIAATDCSAAVKAALEPMGTMIPFRVSRAGVRVVGPS
jgi:D-glycero-alpha-D-manno-heptose-7-phosphate kinase